MNTKEVFGKPLHQVSVVFVSKLINIINFPFGEKFQFSLWNYFSNSETKSVLLLGQVFALLPLNGILSSSSKDMYFTWRSLRTIYSCIAVVFFAIHMGFTYAWAFKGTLSFDSIGKFTILHRKFMMGLSTFPFHSRNDNVLYHNIHRLCDFLETCRQVAIYNVILGLCRKGFATVHIEEGQGEDGIQYKTGYMHFGNTFIGFVVFIIACSSASFLCVEI